MYCESCICIEPVHIDRCVMIDLHHQLTVLPRMRRQQRSKRKKAGSIQTLPRRWSPLNDSFKSSLQSCTVKRRKLLAGRLARWQSTKNLRQLAFTWQTLNEPSRVSSTMLTLAPMPCAHFSALQGAHLHPSSEPGKTQD